MEPPFKIFVVSALIITTSKAAVIVINNIYGRGLTRVKEMGGKEGCLVFHNRLKAHSRC